MKILILSDLHIGAGKQFDTFEWKIDDFILILEHFEKKFQVERIVLNGDVFDLYQHSYADIEKANESTINYFSQDKFIYVRGNHDISMPKTQQSFSLKNKKSQTVHIEHGHRADFLNGTVFGQMIGKYFFKTLKHIMHFEKIQRSFMAIVRFNDNVDRIPRKYDSYKYLNYALKLLRKADFVILGHTHKLEEHKTFYLNRKKVYVNTGSCSLGRFQAIFLDTETLKYETIKLGKKSVIRKLEKLKQSMTEILPETS